MNELCLANLTVAEAAPLEVIDAAAAGGFGSVNLWLVEPPALAHFRHVKRPGASVVGDATSIEAIRRRCRERAVGVFTASAGWIGPDFTTAMIAPVIETLAALEARSLCVVGWDPDRSRLMEHFIAACEAAARYRLAVHLEFMAYSAIRTVREARDFLAQASQPNARLIIDALHLDRSGGTPEDVAALEPTVIASVQLCDAPGARPPRTALRDESVNARLLPGEGDLPLFALMDALPEDVVIELEAPGASLFGLSIEERAKRCGAASRRFLAEYAAMKASRSNRPH